MSIVSDAFLIRFPPQALAELLKSKPSVASVARLSQMAYAVRPFSFSFFPPLALLSLLADIVSFPQDELGL
jgi:hypothetical protein